MSRYLYTLLLFFAFYCSAQAQIVRVDTVKNQYVYVKAKTDKTVPLQSDYSYSLGIKAFSIEQFPKILNQVDDSDFQKNGFTGLIFKFNDNQISYRISGSYLEKDYSFRNECVDCEQVDGRLSDFTAKLGFEKSLIYARLQPYFGIDLGFRKNLFKGSAKDASTTPYTAPYDTKAEKNAAFVSPILGLKLNVIDRLTLAAEASLDLTYSYERQEKNYQDASRTRSVVRYNKWEFLNKPLGMLSLQYNFGFAY